MGMVKKLQGMKPRLARKKDGELTVKEKTAWGVSGSSENILHNTTNMLANPILNIGLGVSPVLVSVALTIPRIWDAFTDPLMGRISDNFKSSKMGRRRPFVLYGGILTGLAFAMIWMLPHGWSQMATFWLFFSYMMIFYTCFTVFIVPYLALGFEMSPDYNERTTLMSYRSFFSLVGSILMQWIYWGCTRPCFSDTVQGMKVVGSILGGFVICTTVITALVCKERVPQVKIVTERKISFYESVSVAWTVRPFVRVIAVCVLIIVGQLSIMQIGMYLNIYYVCHGSQEFAGRLQGITGTGYTVSSLLVIPTVAWCSRHFGKKATLRTLMTLGAVGSLLSWVLITPKYPYLQMLGLFLAGPATTGLWIIAPSMIADACDFDEWKSGLRREGAFGAAYGWFTKIGSSASVFVSGLVLVFTGFHQQLGANQAPGTILGMRVLVAVVPAVTFMIANLILRNYEISAELANDIKGTLKERNK